MGDHGAGTADRASRDRDDAFMHLLQALLDREQVRDTADREQARALTLLAERQQEWKAESDGQRETMRHAVEQLQKDHKQLSTDVQALANHRWTYIVIVVLVLGVLALAGVTVQTRYGTLTPDRGASEVEHGD